MPELPEVETTVERLRPLLSRQQIRGITILWPRTISCPGVRRFRHLLRGASIAAIGRRAKYVVFSLVNPDSQPFTLLSHLRMSGRFEVLPSSAHLPKHSRVVFALSGGQRLVFVDPRKFGRFYLTASPEKMLSRFGPEPLDPLFRARDFAALLANRHRALKALLLDQSIIAGLGNIYTDESLWAARIHPCRKASSLTMPEATALYRAIRRTLRKALADEGTDNGDGVVIGKHIPRVYGREGMPCPRCGEELLKHRVNQRGTHFCPSCQRA